MSLASRELAILKDIDNSPYKNKSSQKILLILSKFSNPPFVYGVSNLARELNMTKNMIHRSLATLVNEGYLVRHPDGKQYQLGYRALEFQAEGHQEFDIRNLCRPYLEQLHALTGESLFLSIIVGRSRVNIDGIEARGPRVSHVQRAKPDPLHRLQMSRILLAFLSDAEIKAYIAAGSPLNAHPETPDADEQELLADLARLRKDGFSIWHGSGAFSAAYVSFPVLDQNQRPHASITVGGPLERFDMKKAEAMLPHIMAIARDLNNESRLFPAPPVWFGKTESHP